MLRWAKGRGATVTTTPRPTATARPSDSPPPLGDARWQLAPQVKLGGVQPDFVLTCADPEVPRIAVFCDGRRWHSSRRATTGSPTTPESGRAARQGLLVWAMTHRDLDAFAAVLDGASAVAVPWAVDDDYAPGTAGRSRTPGGARQRPYRRRRVADPFSVLADFLAAARAGGVDAGGPRTRACLLGLGTGAQGRRAGVPDLLRSALSRRRVDSAEGDLPVADRRGPRGRGWSCSNDGRCSTMSRLARGRRPRRRRRRPTSRSTPGATGSPRATSCSSCPRRGSTPRAIRRRHRRSPAAHVDSVARPGGKHWSTSPTSMCDDC